VGVNGKHQPLLQTPFSALGLEDLLTWAKQRELPAYRARQFFRALSRQGISEIGELTEFPLGLREQTDAERPLRSLQVRMHLHSPTDGSQKVLFALADGMTVETVLIPSSRSADPQRYTVCVSSQVGCPAGCTFCATGLSGFGRNLTGYEIADQVMYFAGALRRERRRVTNVVFMGMGEPFLNVPSVRDAVQRLTDPAGFGLGQRHLTVSTVGIVPQIRKFAEWGGQVNLAISLHAPNDELRSSLVPYNQRFPISDLMAAALDYIAATRRRVSFEYVLLKDANDSAELARELARLLMPFAGGAHVNLIPWNPFREGRFVRSEGPDADAFARVLREGGVNATIRYSKGLDISAACGQLRDIDELKKAPDRESGAAVVSLQSVFG
jgi:23S rRNA (adenine2503-C2)-methyltransferase